MPSNHFAQFFGYTSFGESHGAAIGLVIDSPPPNLDFPHAALQEALQKRNISTPFKTPRQESDEYEILSGVFEGKTTGMPLCIIVRNRDANGGDYEALKNVFRPGHADYAWWQKYHIYDYRGGGRASGRETLTRIVAASFTEEILKPIQISLACVQIGAMKASTPFRHIENPFHWPDADSLGRLYQYLESIKAKGDSLGGILEVRATNVPAGLGDPVYEKLSANIAKAMLSIPSVKGISFGEGEALAALTGSEVNDQISSEGFLSNHLGGLNGGVSNGNDMVFRLIIRPVASVATAQKTVDKAGTNREINISGRHDTCHIPRIIPVVEAMLKLCLADAIQHQKLISGEAQNLSSYREALDKLDEELLLLLYRRRQIVQHVKGYKQEHRMSARDEQREEEILTRVEALAMKLGLDPQIVLLIFTHTLQSSQ